LQLVRKLFSKQVVVRKKEGEYIQKKRKRGTKRKRAGVKNDF